MLALLQNVLLLQAQLIRIMQKYDYNNTWNCGIPNHLFTDSVVRETSLFEKGFVLVEFIDVERISHIYIPQRTSTTDVFKWASEALRKGVVPILASWYELSSNQLERLLSLSEESGVKCVFEFRNPRGFLSLGDLNPQGKPSYLSVSTYFAESSYQAYRSLAFEYLISAQLVLGAHFRKVNQNVLKTVNGDVFMHEYTAVSNRGDRLVLTVSGSKGFADRISIETADIVANSDSGNYFAIDSKTDGELVKRYHITPISKKEVLWVASDSLLCLSTAKFLDTVLGVSVNA